MEDTIRRLEEILKHTGESINSLGKAIGLKRSQNLYDIRDGKVKKFSFELASLIVKQFPDLNLDWIISGTGKMENTGRKPYTEQRRELKNSAEDSLLYYEVGARASTYNTGDILPVPKNDGVLHIGDLFKGSQYAIRISGNSMTPNYPSGAIIGIREIHDKLITPGSVYVIEKENDLWLKRLYYKDDDQSSGIIECISDNTMKHDHGHRSGKLCYPSFDIQVDDIRKLFKVTGIYKPNELTVIN